MYSSPNVGGSELLADVQHQMAAVGVHSDLTDLHRFVTLFFPDLSPISQEASLEMRQQRLLTGSPRAR